MDTEFRAISNECRTKVDLDTILVIEQWLLEDFCHWSMLEPKNYHWNIDLPNNKPKNESIWIEKWEKNKDERQIHLDYEGQELEHFDKLSRRSFDPERN